MNKHRKLVAWQYCRELAREVYRATAGFPLALGSLAEVDALLEIANDLRFLATGDYDALLALRDRASRATFGLQRKVRP